MIRIALKLAVKLAPQAAHAAADWIVYTISDTVFLWRTIGELQDELRAVPDTSPRGPLPRDLRHSVRAGAAAVDAKLTADLEDAIVGSLMGGLGVAHPPGRDPRAPISDYELERAWHEDGEILAICAACRLPLTDEPHRCAARDAA